MKKCSVYRLFSLVIILIVLLLSYVPFSGAMAADNIVTKVLVDKSNQHIEFILCGKNVKFEGNQIIMGVGDTLEIIATNNGTFEKSLEVRFGETEHVNNYLEMVKKHSGQTTSFIDLYSLPPQDPYLLFDESSMQRSPDFRAIYIARKEGRHSLALSHCYVDRSNEKRIDHFYQEFELIITNQPVSTAPAAKFPTLTNFSVTPTSAAEGESFSISGKINGNGNTITAVGVGVRNAQDQGIGGYWFHDQTLNTSSFDLSSIKNLKAGSTIGNFTLDPGEYIVEVFVTTSSKRSFEKAHTARITVEEKSSQHPTLSNFKISPSTVEAGDQISVSGKINGNGNTITAVSVTVRNAENESLGGYWGHEQNLKKTSFDLSSFGKIKAGDKVEDLSLTPGKYIVQVYVTTDTGMTFATDQKTTLCVEGKPVEPVTLSKFKVSPVSAEEGEKFSISGKINGNGSKITAVSVGVRNAKDERYGGYWGEKKKINKSSFDLSSFGKLKAGDKIGNTILKPGEYIVEVFVTTDTGANFKSKQTTTITVTQKEIELLGAPEWAEAAKEITSEKDDVYLYYQVDEDAKYVLLSYEECDENGNPYGEPGTLGVHPVKKRFGYVLSQFKDYPYSFNDGLKDKPFSQFTAPITKLYLTVSNENETPLSETSAPMYIYRTDLLTEALPAVPEWVESKHTISSDADSVEMLLRVDENTEFVKLYFEEYDEKGKCTHNDWDEKTYPVQDADGNASTLGAPFDGFTAPVTKIYLAVCNDQGNLLTEKSGAMTVVRQDMVKAYNDLLDGEGTLVASIGDWIVTAVEENKYYRLAYRLSESTEYLYARNGEIITLEVGNTYVFAAQLMQENISQKWIQPGQAGSEDYHFSVTGSETVSFISPIYVTANKTGSATISLSNQKEGSVVSVDIFVATGSIRGPIESEYTLICDSAAETSGEFDYIYTNLASAKVDFSITNTKTGGMMDVYPNSIYGRNSFALYIDDQYVSKLPITVSKGAHIVRLVKIYNGYNIQSILTEKDVTVDTRALVIGKKVNNINASEIEYFINNYVDGGGFQLADQVMMNVNANDVVLIETLMTAVDPSRLWEVIKASVSPEKYDEQLHKNVLIEIIKNLPNTDTSVIDAINTKNTNLNNTKRIIKIIKNLTGETVDINKIADENGKLVLDGLLGDNNIVSKLIGNKHIGALSQIAQKDFNYLIEQSLLLASAKLTYFDILREKLPSGDDFDAVRAAIDDMETRYTQGYISGMLSETAKICIDMGVSKGIEKVIKAIIPTYSVVSFFADFFGEVSGAEKFGDNAIKILANEVYLTSLETQLDQLVVDTNNIDYERLIQTYDLWRAAMIVKNEYAKSLTYNQSVIDQLCTEIEQLKNMDLNEWRMNNLYDKEFAVCPQTAELNYGLDKLVQSDVEGYGYSARWNEKSFQEKQLVRKFVKDLASFAEGLTSDQYQLFLYQSALSDAYHFMIRNTNGDGLLVLQQGVSIAISIVDSHSIDELNKSLTSDYAVMKSISLGLVEMDGSLVSEEYTVRLKANTVSCVITEEEFASIVSMLTSQEYGWYSNRLGHNSGHLLFDEVLAKVLIDPEGIKYESLVKNVWKAVDNRK